MPSAADPFVTPTSTGSPFGANSVLCDSIATIVVVERFIADADLSPMVATDVRGSVGIIGEICRGGVCVFGIIGITTHYNL